MSKTYAHGHNARRPLADRFWEKVRRSDGCWEWTGALDHKEYGIIGGSPEKQAHRCAWALYYGAVPEGKLVLHRCDNRKCVRPDHLFLGVAQDNTDDMILKGRNATGDRHWTRLPQHRATVLRVVASMHR